MKRLAAACGAALAAAAITLAVPASAAPGHPSRCAASMVRSGVTNGRVSLVRWSLNRHSGAAGTIYATERCYPATAFSLRFEKYIDGANLLKPMPAGLRLATPRSP